MVTFRFTHLRTFTDCNSIMMAYTDHQSMGWIPQYRAATEATFDTSRSSSSLGADHDFDFRASNHGMFVLA